MKRIHGIGICWIILILAIGVFSVSAQDEFAASLEVLNSGVEVQRVNTANFIAVEVEAIVGVGDIIRTDDSGQARITFFADGTDVTLEPSTEYHIVQFRGDNENFQLTVEVLAGQTTHRLNRVLSPNSSYNVETPGMTLAAKGTVFAIRVEEDGRSGMLVHEGLVDSSAGQDSADVPEQFGVRADVGGELSDVVRAATFAELDSALDGCAVEVTTSDDVSINVRSGPSVTHDLLGVISAEEITKFIGTNAGESAWYRIPFEDGFGWVLSSTAVVQSPCAGLRVFEDVEFGISIPVEVDASVSPEATEEPEAEAGSDNGED
jgi:uncharacterized protein YraI